jgi:hypothetical protein
MVAATFKGTFNGQVEERFCFIQVVAGKSFVEP